ncbi:MAG: MarR family transcriptional regulator [Acidobacteriaceae bacterium]|nr:MarR family transcriptional regulator [Acidobacteriaceae bacterium]
MHPPYNNRNADISAAHTSFRAPSQEAYLRLLAAASRLSRQVDELLRTFGISQPQYNVLRILAGADSAGLGRNEIAARMIATTPDMTRLLNRMAEKGWVHRERGAQDRREVPTTLTEPGRELLQRIDRPLEALHLQQFAAFGEGGDGAFLRSLRVLAGVDGV